MSRFARSFRYLFSTALLALCISLFIAVNGASVAHARQLFGIENEYEGINGAHNIRDYKNHISLLDFVWRHFGITGEIRMRPSLPDHDLHSVELDDADNRLWQVMPEYMRDDYDGYELVSPPMIWELDGVALKLLLKHIRLDQHFVAGPRSSTHFTLDVSHLLTDPNDVSALVDLILFIENHMLEIFNVIGPQRYGQHMNLYTVPLGLNQPELLIELAELPRHQRSWSRVAKIFARYSKQEIILSGGNILTAWKYRAVNYGKLFGLGMFAGRQIPAFEFRIPDLVDDRNIEPLVHFLSRVIEVGSRTPSKRFLDPFYSIPKFSHEDLDGENHARVDRLIENLSPTKYDSFLRRLGLRADTFPQKYRAQKTNSARKNFCEALFAH